MAENGWYIEYSEDGATLRKQMFINGQRHGVFIDFLPNGDTMLLGNYMHDQKHGEWKYYSMGIKKGVEHIRLSRMAIF